MFLEHKTDNSFALNFFKLATSFLHRYAKLKILSSLLLKLVLKKFNVSIILLVQSDGLICVSVNPIISLFIILLSLAISSTFLEMISHYKQEL